MSLGIIDTLIGELMRLPGIGRKSAQRLAFFIMGMNADEARSIAMAILDLKDNARFCAKCFNISGSDICDICADDGRDRTKVCVVEEPSNIMVIERAGIFRGRYHVLLGALSPIDGVTPDKLKIGELLKRIGEENIEEVIVATNPNTKGEMTAQYIAQMLRDKNVIVTRIAYGLPMGSDIEFADEVTLSKSIEGRRKI
jgi:recombination protein RecR